jgi:hypothetical protein
MTSCLNHPEAARCSQTALSDIPRIAESPSETDAPVKIFIPNRPPTSVDFSIRSLEWL